MTKTSQLFSGLGAALFLATAWAGNAGVPFLTAVGLGMLAVEWLSGFRRRPAGLAPYPLLMVSPLTLILYSSANDFRVRLFCLVLLAYLASLAALASGRDRRSLVAPRRTLTVWALAGLFFALSAVWLTNRGIYFSGDEPHYLMVAQSLAEDGDFDLKNNIADKTYRRFHPAALDAHVKEINGRRLSFHMPGLAILLVPFYWVYGWLGQLLPPQLFFRLAMALLNSLFIFGLVTVLKKQFPDFNAVCLGLWLALSFPLLFQSVHLYPELPAATLMAGAYLFACLHRRHYAVSGLLLALIPWFHLKYSLAVAVLALFIGWRLLRKKEFANLVRFLLFPALGLALLILYTRILYGSFNPNQIPQPLDYRAITLLKPVETFFSFFLDQRDGILIYCPFLLFAFLGLRKKWWPEGDHFRVLTWVFWSYIIFHAVSLNRPGYSPAGRTLMFVFWIMAVFIAAFLRHNRDERWQFAFQTSVGWTILATCWLLIYPLFMYQPVDSSVTQRGASLAFFLGSEWIRLPDFFPSFLRSSNLGHLANYGWIMLIAAAIFLYYRRGGTARPFHNQNVAGATGFIFLVALLCLFPHVYLRQSHLVAGGRLRFFCNSGNFIFVSDTGAFQLKAGGHYDIFVDARHAKKDTMAMTLLNGDDVRLELWNKSSRLFRSSGARTERFSFDLMSLRTLRVKNSLVVPIGIDLESPVANSFLFLRFE